MIINVPITTTFSKVSCDVTFPHVNFLHLEWPYSNINLGPKIWRSFLRISSRCWKKRRRRIHTSFKLDNYSNQTWQSAVSLFTKATRKAACEQASKWRGVKIKKNSPSETTRAWPEKKKRLTCRLSFDVAHSPTCNYPPRRVGGQGGELSLRKYVVQSACQYDARRLASVTFQNGEHSVHLIDG